MLKLRIITAVCMALAFIAMLFALSPVIFSISIIPVVLMAGWEWCNLVKLVRITHKALFLVLVSSCLAIVAVLLDVTGDFDFQLAQTLLIIAVGLWAVILLWIQGYPSSAILWSSKPVLITLGAALLMFTWVSIVSVLLHASGQWLLLVGILIVVMVDVGGFFVGKSFGRRKLAAVVSPGKTWEGFAGGMLFQLVIAGGLLVVLPDEFSVFQILLIWPVALFAVIGDLFESMVKRQSGVKDSGSILPGHGGVLDRIDGIMAAMPIYALLIHSLGII